MKLKNVPNTLSIIRILLVPVFVYLFLSDKITAAVVIFILSGFTDVLDGYIARKFDCSTNLGKLLDPLADKLMQFSAFICLCISELIPYWMPVVYFVKEVSTAIGALFVFRKGKRVVKSHIFGKLATVFVFAFVSVVAIFGDRISRGVITALCVAMCLYFVFSNLMYVKTEVKGAEKEELEVRS